MRKFIQAEKGYRIILDEGRYESVGRKQIDHHQSHKSIQLQSLEMETSVKEIITNKEPE